MDWKDLITWGLLLYIVSQENSQSAGCGCGCGGSGGCNTTLSQGTTPEWMMGPLRPLMLDAAN